MVPYGLQWRVLQDYFAFQETANSSAWGLGGTGKPPANMCFVYAKDLAGVSHMYFKDDANVEWAMGVSATAVTGTGSANRLAYWTGAQTIDDLSALTQGRVMFPDSNGLPTGSASLFWDNSNSRLGVGTASPSSSFHIATNSDNGIILDRYQNNGGAPNGGLDIRGGRGTIASPSAVANNDSLAGFRGYGYGTSFAGAADGALFIKAGEAFSGSAHGTYITLETTPTGSTTRAERFRVGPSGQWGIGGATFGTANNIFKSGGASAAPSWGTVNILDSDSHGDTLTGTVVRGDIIIGNSTPKWARLARGSSGAFVRNDGSDVQWSTLILPNSATANRIAYATSSNTYGESANLAYDGSDFLLGSGTRARMSGQNRFRYLNSMCRAVRSTSQSINTATFTSINLNGTETFDTDSMHDTVTNNTRVVCNLTGKYLLLGLLQFDTNATGNRILRFLLNGSSGAGDTSSPACSGINHFISAVQIITLTATDFIEIQAYQDSGGSLDVLSAALGMVYIGE